MQLSTNHIKKIKEIISAVLFINLLIATQVAAGQSKQYIDLHNAVIVLDKNPKSTVEKTAVRVLVEEIEKRTGIRLNTMSGWPKNRPVIAVFSGKVDSEWQGFLPQSLLNENRNRQAEGYQLIVQNSDDRQIVWNAVNGRYNFRPISI